MLAWYKAIVIYFQWKWKNRITTLEIPLEVSDKVKYLPIDSAVPLVGIYPRK